MKNNLGMLGGIYKTNIYTQTKNVILENHVQVLQLSAECILILICKILSRISAVHVTSQTNYNSSSSKSSTLFFSSKGLAFFLLKDHYADPDKIKLLLRIQASNICQVFSFLQALATSLPCHQHPPQPSVPTNLLFTWRKQ